MKGKLFRLAMLGARCPFTPMFPWAQYVYFETVRTLIHVGVLHCKEGGFLWEWTFPGKTNFLGAPFSWGRIKYAAKVRWFYRTSACYNPVTLHAPCARPRT